MPANTTIDSVYTKKNVYERLYFEVRYGNINNRRVEIWQDKPYTAVKLDAEGVILDIPFLNYFYRRSRDKNGIPCVPVATGWAKVNWPDEWSATTGYELALKRACRKIANQLYYGHE